MKHPVFVGTYTTVPPASGEQAEGLHLLEMDAETGSLEWVRSYNVGENPSFLAISGANRCLYVANERSQGEVSAYRVSGGGELIFLNRLPVAGSDPCYLSLCDNDQILLAACYSSGSLAVIDLNSDGSLKHLAQRIQHEGSGPNQGRQEKAHIHCALPAPESPFVLVADLGIDTVQVYRLDGAASRLKPIPPGFQATPGAGPRHIAFHPNRPVVYFSKELGSSVMACEWGPLSGRLKELQLLSTLPDDFKGENTAADIHLTPDGSMLFVSNRGHDSLAAYRVEESGRLKPAGFFECGGKWPRNFAISPEGKFLLCANQHSGNVAVLRIEEDGSLAATGEEARVSAPVCVMFADQLMA